MIPKFRFFGKVADGEMRMVLAETIDFTSGFVYYSYHDYTVEGDDNKLKILPTGLKKVR